MNLPLTFRNLSIANRVRSDALWPQCKNWTPSDWALALAGEMGEVLNEIKHLKLILDPRNCQEEGFTGCVQAAADRVLTIQKIGHELADLVIYADLLAQCVGVELHEAIVGKFNLTSIKFESPIRLTPTLPDFDHDRRSITDIEEADEESEHFAS